MWSRELTAEATVARTPELPTDRATRRQARPSVAPGVAPSSPSEHRTAPRVDFSRTQGSDFLNDVFSEAEARYRDACDRRHVVLEMWEREGRPLLATGSTGQLTEHPLVRLAAELDVLCDRLAKPLLPARKPGRPPAAVISSSITPSP